jgi:hypothetical protein
MKNQIRLHLEGERYGKLVVMEEAESIYSKTGKMIRRWKCKCDCGNITIVRHGDLRNGSTVSCGCYNYEKESAAKTHGYSRTKLGNVFEGMKQRCNNPKNKNYEKYGGRGIKICTEWLNDPKKFFDWAIKNGYKEGLSIDRIDVNGNYEPDNCRWADNEAQCLNQRLRKDNKTGHKGIYYSEGVYRVQIGRNKKRYYFGSYKTLPEAVKVLEDAKAMVEEAQPKEPALFGDEE